MLDYFFIKKDPITKIIKWSLLIGQCVNLVCSFILLIMLFTNMDTVYGLSGVDIDGRPMDNPLSTKIYEVLRKFIYEDMSVIGMFELSMLFATLLDSGMILVVCISGYSLPVLRSFLNLSFSQAECGPLLFFYAIKLITMALSIYYAYCVWNIGPLSLENYAKEDLEMKERERQKLMLENDITRIKLNETSTRMDYTKVNPIESKTDYTTRSSPIQEERKKKRSRKIARTSQDGKISPQISIPSRTAPAGSEVDPINTISYKMPQY